MSHASAQLVAGAIIRQMTDPHSDERSRRTRHVVAWLLLAMVLAGAWDLTTDSPGIWSSGHAVVELAFMGLAGLSALLLFRGWRETEDSLERVQDALATRQAERDHWHRLAESALRGLGEAMDRQFDEWSLTPAEKETALFLLKGYSHKEAARLTGRSERTVRQHAVSVYRKSGLGGRAELAAFFFEDMLLPSATVTPASPVEPERTPAG
jgi:DNA-binding CsgD family transcriptional regulator